MGSPTAKFSSQGYEKDNAQKSLRERENEQEDTQWRFQSIKRKGTRIRKQMLDFK